MVTKSGGDPVISDPQPVRFGDPYSDWALRLAEDDPERLRFLGKVPLKGRRITRLPDLWVPTLLRIRSDALQRLEGAYYRQEDGEVPDLVVDTFQLNPKFVRGDATSLIVYERLDSDALAEKGFSEENVLHRWGAVTQFELPLTVKPQEGLSFGMMRSETESENTKVLVGIIDDGIGFLNGRFRAGNQTRFRSLWLQTKVAAPDSLPDLDTLAAEVQTRSEAEIYRDLARQVFDPGTRHRMLDLESHGTHMLDLAAGADPFGVDDVSSVGILGVQVPPVAYDDTSGTQLEPYLIAGLYWLGQEANRLGAETLLINISLGITAGPKNGTGIVEHAIAQFLEAMEGIAETRVFLPFGNSYQEQLAAEMTVSNREPREVEWQLPPDDLTAGYIEIQQLSDDRTQVVDVTGDITLIVTPPGAGSVTIDVDAEVPVGSFVDIDTDGQIVARLSRLTADSETGRPEYLALCFAPTRQYPGGETELLSPAGRWHLEVQAQDCDRNLTLQIQRDDEPSGAVTGARQIYFTGGNTRTFSARGREHSDLGAGGPVVYAGSNSAYANVSAPNATSVGGSVVRPVQGGGADDIRPARYASEGAEWSSAGPDCAAVSETEYARPGVRAAGTFSSGVARLSGSSTASATALRCELETVLGTGNIPLVGIPNAVHASRLGGAVVSGNPAIRTR